ncbi:DUF1697 domain-containing protein [Aggregatimonas sangjinii]|uniref:DUF1697 domain-containing protein n=1 Tax=Aggregatimonas sangjinii TaxID=2583587 RepID=A0A5B7SNT3_9FLAO|nr:DUF1697 domain-containing protein [Aggregatimonas sangjinii]QCW98652.1 DUF1697 domain-containing protein [Aggregatimonas sangjinii]
MHKYIALLRGINVSGQKKIIMSELRDMLKALNFQDVETYIQSGNIALKSSEGRNAKVAEKIKKAIADTFGYDVPVLVKTYGELKSIFKKNPFTDASDIEHKRVYFALLQETPQPELIKTFQQEKFEAEAFMVTNDCVYLNYKMGAGKAKLSNTLIERKLKVSATSRNYRTMVKLLEMAQ